MRARKLLALNVEEGAMSQGTQVPLEAEGAGHRFSPRASKRNATVTPRLQPSETRVGLLTSRAGRA